MNYNILKKKAALAALDYLYPGIIIGVGSGSTIEYFIEGLSSIKNQIKGAVSSSEITTKKLKEVGIKIFELNQINILSTYIDSADEINPKMQMIKGGGGALTREKIIASASNKFICIVDESKQVDVLGKFPLPVEVIPMAKNFVSKELKKFGGYPKYRKNVLTDNGNIIIDIHNLHIFNPQDLEKKIKLLPGVITVGIFAKRIADIALISTSKGIKKLFSKK